jgi:hypothetical protein
MDKLLCKLKPFTLLLLALIAGCSSGPTGQQPSSVPAPVSNLATVYFYRTQASLGAATGVDLKDNGLDIGTLQDGTYFVYHANPGQHVLTATTDSTATQNFKFQAGGTYYIKAAVMPRQHIFHPSLSVVFNLEGQSALQNLKHLHYHE